jgi:hypothetical protein
MWLVVCIEVVESSKVYNKRLINTTLKNTNIYRTIEARKK